MLRLIARGRTNREVAGELHPSAKTVGRQVENLYVEIDVSSRAAAAVVAMPERLLDRWGETGFHPMRAQGGWIP